MSSKIFDTILNRKIENFVSTFVEDSESIFYNDLKKLIHPGEFGRYRENSIKDLLRMLTQYKVSDGFIITSKDGVSKQCDIVIYDNSDFPILDDNFVQFFTIESVIAIGEVKSKLNYSTFAKALLTMAENKKLSDQIDGVVKKRDISDCSEFDLPVSFLVFKKASFDLASVDFDILYKGIDRKYWHNMILIVEQGYFAYSFGFKSLIEPERSLFLEKEVDLSSGATYETSYKTFGLNKYSCTPYFNELSLLNKYEHIQMFLAGISQAMANKTLYNTHILHYSNLEQAKILKEH